MSERWRCSGTVCIEYDCPRHSMVGELYCGEHGGPPEYDDDPREDHGYVTKAAARTHDAIFNGSPQKWTHEDIRRAFVAIESEAAPRTEDAAWRLITAVNALYPSLTQQQWQEVGEAADALESLLGRPPSRPT